MRMRMEFSSPHYFRICTRPLIASVTALSAKSYAKAVILGSSFCLKDSLTIASAHGIIDWCVFQLTLLLWPVHTGNVEV